METIDVKLLKALALKPAQELKDFEARQLIYSYIFMQAGVPVKQVYTAQVGDEERYNKCLDICKNYFKSFIFDEETNN